MGRAAVTGYEDEAAALVGLLRANLPPELYVPTAAGLAHRLAHLPARARQRLWLVERGGGVVAAARASFNWRAAEEGIGRVEVEVLRAWRRRGLGSELLAVAERYVTE